MKLRLLFIVIMLCLAGGASADDADRLADTRYGGRAVCAAAMRGSVLGCQFHPEKSGDVGLRILQQFLQMR